MAVTLPSKAVVPPGGTTVAFCPSAINGIEASGTCTVRCALPAATIAIPVAAEAFWPAVRPMAPTVPAIGAVRVVAARLFWAIATLT